MNNGNATLAPIACQSERTHCGPQQPELRHDRVSSLEDFNGWEELETEQVRRTSEPINGESQGTEQDWLQWFNRTAMESLPNPILVAPAVLSKKVAPGTPEQRSKYVHEFTNTSNARLTAAVRAYRYKSVYAVWPDGSKTGPDMPAGLGIERMKWLMGQSHPTKYLEWYRKVDAEGYAAFLATHPSYRTQSPQTALAVFVSMDQKGEAA